MLLGVTAGFLRADDAKSKPDDFSGVIRSVKNGRWSEAATWEKGVVPGANAKVQIRPGHTVTYDVKSDEVIRGIHVGGTLTFARDKDTLLNVGLILIQSGEKYGENGFDCDAHAMLDESDGPKPVLEVGTAGEPIPAGRTAVIRLHYVPGMDKLSAPAIVSCGGRMDFHGAPMNRTWVKLGETAKVRQKDLVLAEPVTGWKAGDKLIITATTKDPNEAGSRRPGKQNRKVFTEERTIKAVDGTKLTLDEPLEFNHLGTGEFRGEVANLSRNVVVESADPKTERGHTMYHKGSAGSISYAEFRHLGKEGVLGRYPLHFHLCKETMRGSSVVGASIWDSGNHWLTVHGTNYLVVKDTIGYQCVGHGFFMEDGTEIDNVFDRNLAVQAFAGKPLPKQALPFDENNGAGYWWPNSLNTFTRNVSCENDRYGYRFEATKTSQLAMTFPIRQPDGSKKTVDIRTLPFVRFEDNEAHCDGLYGINIGEGVNRVGPDMKHPFVLRRTKIWAIHYAFRVQSPCVMVEDMVIDRSTYGVYHPNYDHHVYRNLTINGDGSEPFNRGHDDISAQYGPLTVDGLTFTNVKGYKNSLPLIQMTDDNPTGLAVAHFRNVREMNRQKGSQRPMLDMGGGAQVAPTTSTGVPVYLHDYPGTGKQAKVMLANAKDFGADGLKYHSDAMLAGQEARVTDVQNIEFPKLLDPTDDLPPTTVITYTQIKDGKLLVRGTTSDNGPVKKVTVNGKEVKASSANFAEWEIVLDDVKPGSVKLTATAEDAAENVEKTPHVVTVAVR